MAGRGPGLVALSSSHCWEQPRAPRAREASLYGGHSLQDRCPCPSFHASRCPGSLQAWEALPQALSGVHAKHPFLSVFGTI